MVKEIWKDIKEYEGLYQVSNLGRVKSLGNGGFNQFQGVERILSLCANSSGYYIVVLVNSLVKKTKSVHRLVSLNFIKNPNNDKVVNHKDGNKLNNYIDNLEWCSYSENAKHAYRVLGKKPPKIWHNGLKKGLSPFSKRVKGFDCLGKQIYLLNSVIESKELGFTPSLVAMCARGERSHHKNIIWKYI